tara:strand:+ start:47 stop:490 length:444 start_codon:yes stop_codon:yes gene_type:complete
MPVINLKSIKSFLKSFFKEARRLKVAFLVLAKVLDAGDVAYFTYHYPKGETKNHIILITKTKRAPDSLYVSSKNNFLITAFSLNSVSPGTAAYVINRLYSKGVLTREDEMEKAKYFDNNYRSLMSLFGAKAFRTYNASRMSSVRKIS